MPGTGSSEMDHGGMDMPMSMGPITDTGFLRKGIISNMMEIKMSEAARDRGNSAVRKVAAQMIKDHTQMLSDLTSLAGKMGVEVPDESTMSMNTMDDMTSDQFNRTWATQMFVMHKKKVRDLQMAIPKLQDPTLKAAASSALPKVKLHTEMLAKLPRNGSK
jgi:predicted outer membrane protein